MSAGKIGAWIDKHLPGLKRALATLISTIGEIGGKLSAAAVRAASYLVSLVTRTGENLASFAIQHLLMLYLLFFRLRDGEATYRKVNAYIPLPEDQKDQFLTQL